MKRKRDWNKYSATCFIIALMICGVQGDELDPSTVTTFLLVELVLLFLTGFFAVYGNYIDHKIKRYRRKKARQCANTDEPTSK